MAAGTNRLLEKLPAEYRTTLLARMEAITLPVPVNLYEPGVVPKYAHFMTSGVTSVVTFMEDGNGVEVGLIGREGLVEGMHLLGAGLLPTTGFIQVDGTALRMSFAELRREFQSSEMLRTLILAEVQAQNLVLGQIAACNRLHELEERLARWLLMVSDRLESDHFTLTQEFLAEMIGARRTTVTLAAGSLQRSGLIEYKRGHIKILDREGLESAACECYPIVRDLIETLYLLG
ncbi:Crp/Fnr family transcriptional regulator [Granulicella tundricola]|uniref:Putative transcriptional regulator, Crp/Fnr family n=1 Tax=Granulicella tundricola (strain ATCC BAA-1859 / DSM 23138 / MP5ACTX9) TaxID=1198114 RepID=E8X5I0_GRATM|nr:Crp/Fnr family transcriptional regulator [Granulicella tundricola]ADW69527.1 putative transcriptional regulator, Crp/Fnr family [Granulicella tundricola MP5ACTX9]